MHNMSKTHSTATCSSLCYMYRELALFKISFLDCFKSITLLVIGHSDSYLTAIEKRKCDDYTQYLI